MQAKKGITQERQELYQRILNDDWDYKWRIAGCQRFIVTGRLAFTFCGAAVMPEAYLCPRCASLTIRKRLLEKFHQGELTPEQHFAERKQYIRDMAYEQLPRIDDV